MAEHPIQGLMNVTMDKIRQMADSNTIIGKPIKTDDGTTIQPVAFLVVKDGCVRTIQLSDGSNTVDRALTMLPELVDKVSALLKKEEKKGAAAPAAPAAE